MFTNILPENTLKLLNETKDIEFLKSFYLSGGTGLALQLGHRQSEDLDFFSLRPFNPQLLQTELAKIGALEDVEIATNTLNLFLDDVKLQFLYYPYKLLENLIYWQGINVSSVLDIACTKLLTISERGSKKDFIDLYFILDKYPLSFLFEKLEEKYEGTNYNKIHILKSLVYFSDADNQPIPRMQKSIDWEDIKKNIIQKTKEIKL